MYEAGDFNWDLTADQTEREWISLICPIRGQYVFELRRTNSNNPAAEPITIPTTRNHGLVSNHRSTSQPSPQNAATDANNVMPAAYA
jgi:hypothetical protein